MTRVQVDDISKTFGATPALDHITLEVKPGELFFLLGPSGCGKTTLLRIIAGLQFPSSGKLLFNGRDVTLEPTEKRNAVMCFQNYALWPHMSVRDNIAFGLQTRHWSRQRQGERVDEMLKLVQLDGYALRRPNELSGGQQQRVALARALAVSPDCLLLDEPLSNLDSKLRVEMRTEIRRICKAAGSTTIYVTHDQREALSVADRIAVMRLGRLEQIGTPEDLYRRPANSFVAEFVGQTNLFKASVESRENGTARVRTPAGGSFWSVSEPPAEQVVVSIRPEHIHRAGSEAAAAGTNRLDAQVVDSTFLGESSEHLLEVAGQRLRCVLSPPLFDPPARMLLEVSAADVVLLRE